MKKVYLKENWVLKNEKIGTISAKVPGCVHTDLLANGVIKDIFYRDNNKEAQWIENENWEYSCVFDAKTGKKAALVFEGLDTYAEITLNGRLLGKVDDMFIPYGYDITELLREKDNNLTIKFESPVKKVEEMPLRKGAFTTERINTRRMQCTYGWDWVERFVTCGIFKDVYICYGADMYVDNTYIYTSHIDDFGAQLSLSVNFKNYDMGEKVIIEIVSPKGDIIKSIDIFLREPVFCQKIDIPNPELWYPNGYGEQPLYTLRVKCGNNVYEEIFGIRTLRVLQLEDAPDSEYYKRAEKFKNGKVGNLRDKNEVFSGFQVIVNGIPIFCKGANWVPCEPFPSEESEKKICNLISNAKAMGLNTLRVWGGGIFENDHFYNACDKAGILVVQDFLMACGTYPEKEEWFIKALNKEAEFAAIYLRNHPCLAWWQGDNENAEWGYDTLDNFTGRDSALRGIAPIIYKLDPNRTFLTSSPYGGVPYSSITRGTTHSTNYLGLTFDYFNNNDCQDYKEFFENYTARFINEEPIFGLSEYSSLRKFLTDSDIFGDESEEMIRYHTKENPGLNGIFDTIKKFTFKVLGDSKDSKDRLFKYRYIGYEWLRVVFENSRRNLGYSNGLLFWMFNDCWPAALSWSLIDYYGLPKAGYYSFKRCAKSVVSSVIQNDDRYILNISNDANSSVKTFVTAYKIDVKTGEIADTYKFEKLVSDYSVLKTELPWNVEENILIVCDIKSENQTDRCFYKQGDLNIKSCDDAIQVIEDNGNLILKANKYIHIVGIDSELPLEDNYFSMLPDEERIIEKVESHEKVTIYSF